MLLVRHPFYIAVREDSDYALPPLKRVPKQWKRTGLGMNFYKQHSFMFPTKDLFLYRGSLEVESLIHNRRPCRNTTSWNGQEFIISVYEKNLF